ncbi:energy-coupling factor transporter transmembrane component T family protein [Aeromicrobium fastidiosum]|uniref:Energy-coupling factor transporter transmembrane protein EcfT n=1 Tax=Aeromicrobium fastidiosum TaxID=52699 RepID=A0A641ARM2_9ACTN|nr:energy-coupling factor transporter transmembrane component T [Aeromicrobium fastidiosum]KAA1380740.1 energy-coupling factor transporter transmembrane protein EcfT [Aeromicrobium fastidiosum]MBP2390359.1 biotin transport system permease protein [Aeromicrobium fastidiosum]
MNELLSAYRPGSTLLHGLPAGPKLGLLALYGVATVVATGPWTATGFLLFSLLLVAWVRIPVRTTLRALRPLLLVVVLVTAFQVWQRGWPTAVHVVGDLLALFIAALVFTATTRIDAMLDAIVRGLGPFRRLGVNPEKVALGFSLMLGALPGVMTIAHETRAAAKARGLERNPRALLVPMAIRTVARAYDTGAALHARGIGDD